MVRMMDTVPCRSSSSWMPVRLARTLMADPYRIDADLTGEDPPGARWLRNR
jgi:hypothetical protein